MCSECGDCPYCGEEDARWYCRSCRGCNKCCTCQATLFDDDELGIDPEDWIVRSALAQPPMRNHVRRS